MSPILIRSLRDQNIQKDDYGRRLKDYDGYHGDGTEMIPIFGDRVNAGSESGSGKLDSSLAIKKFVCVVVKIQNQNWRASFIPILYMPTKSECTRRSRLWRLCWATRCGNWNWPGTRAADADEYKIEVLGITHVNVKKSCMTRQRQYSSATWSDTFTSTVIWLGSWTQCQQGGCLYNGPRPSRNMEVPTTPTNQRSPTDAYTPTTINNLKETFSPSTFTNVCQRMIFKTTHFSL